MRKLTYILSDFQTVNPEEVFIDFLPSLKRGDSFYKTVKPDRKP